MTKFVVCAVRDRAVDGFGIPIFVPSEGAAIRSFADEVNRKESAMAQHPEDYDLYFLGLFDDGSGQFGVDDERGPRQIAIGKSLVRSTD